MEIKKHAKIKASINNSYQNYSVLMPIYINDKPEFFKQALLSILEQTIKSNDIIIIQDGPISDELHAVVEEYNDKYPEINWIIQEENKGLPIVLNVGIEAAKNELIARMDSDDISVIYRCEKQIAEFNKNPELAICGTQIKEFMETPDNIMSERIVPLTHKAILKYSKLRSPFNHPSVMYKKSVIQALGGYDPEMVFNEDYDLFARILHSGYEALNINEPLLLFRFNHDTYKRRKSFRQCKHSISLHQTFLKRKYCNLFEFLIIFFARSFLFLTPSAVTKTFYRFLRIDGKRRLVLEQLLIAEVVTYAYATYFLMYRKTDYHLYILAVIVVTFSILFFYAKLYKKLKTINLLVLLALIISIILCIFVAVSYIVILLILAFIFINTKNKRVIVYSLITYLLFCIIVHGIYNLFIFLGFKGKK